MPAPGLHIASTEQSAVVGVAEDGVVRWATLILPAPVQLIADLDSVAYHQMWSGVLEVALPVWDPLHVWLSDGENQVLLLHRDAEGMPSLLLP